MSFFENLLVVFATSLIVFFVFVEDIKKSSSERTEMEERYRSYILKKYKEKLFIEELEILGFRKKDIESMLRIQKNIEQKHNWDLLNLSFLFAVNISLNLW